MQLHVQDDLNIGTIPSKNQLAPEENFPASMTTSFVSDHLEVPVMFQKDSPWQKSPVASQDLREVDRHCMGLEDLPKRLTPETTQLIGSYNDRLMQYLGLF